MNRYRPLEEAGSGGFGTVQVAWDTRIQRRVAIKCIELDPRDVARAALPDAHGSGAAAAGAPVWDDELGFIDPATGIPLAGPAAGGPSGTPGASEGFPDSDPFMPTLSHVPGLDEARTAALLSDANIVAVYDFEIQGTTAYLIMEYVEGITLTQLLRRYADALTLDVVAAVFASVSHALEVAHANQVLHLDIKPDNVLINRQGQVKVTDFGLATLADASGEGWAGGGTIGYMPLEQMRQEALDARCDEWALASLTYEMLAGQNPFLAPDLERAEAAIEDAELVLPHLCWNDLDAEADDVIFYALDPDREERYATVADFAEELEPFLGDPKRGHRELAAIVGDAEAGEEETEGRARKPHRGLFERFDWKAAAVATRVVAVLGCALLAFVGLANIPPLGGLASPALWGLFALVVLAAALKPHLGTLLAFAALAAGLIAQQAYVAGAVLALAAALWWFFVGRHGSEQADAALAVPLAGAVGAAAFAPVAAGYFLRVRDALATTAFSLVVAVVLAGLGSSSLMGWNPLATWDFAAMNVETNIVAVLVSPRTWCIAASWLAAAVVLAAGCARGTRPLAVVGAFAAAALLAAGICTGAWLASGQISWMPGVAEIVPTALASLAAIAATFIGVPERPYEEELG